MENLQLNARQIMMTCQQLKIASAQNDAAMENKIMKQLKSLADDVVTNDKSWSRFIPYVTAIKAIYDVYEQRSDLFNSCEIAIESLQMMAPLAEYINQEKPASMLTSHLDLALYPMYQMHLKMVSQSIEHDISPITLLADLLKANAHNLSQINPKNPLVEGLYRHVNELEKAGMTGLCGDMELSLYPCIILLGDLWDESKSKYQANHDSQSSVSSNEDFSEMFEILMGCSGRFGIPNNVELDDKIVDMILSPIYESIKSAIDYDNIISDFSTQNPLSNGFSFARAFYNFSYFYTEYCNNRGIVPSTLSQLYIDEAVPYCPSSIAVQLHEEALSCFLSLAETMGLSKDELIEKVRNDDAMLDMAEVSDEYLQPVIISLVETNIEAEGVVLFNRGMALKAMKFDDKIIADEVNDFIQSMNQRKYLKEMPPLFTEHDITAVFREVHYNR